LPQIYGTQWEFKEGKCFLYPVEAPEQLNQRRLEAGLNSIEEYAEEMKRIFRLNDRDNFLLWVTFSGIGRIFFYGLIKAFFSLKSK
jgi:hypothetical protein